MDQLLQRHRQYRSDGSATNNRAYSNTDGGTTWTALTTAA